jgi:hypothetical protein
MSALTFDEQTHTYYLNGQKVPGVTSVLKPLTDYSTVPPDVLQAAADFGKAVHRACELDDLMELDEATMDPALLPYLEAWRQFCAAHMVGWLEIETPVHHSALRYAGTPDRIGYVKGLLSVVDIKTTAELYPSVGPQLAAYANAWSPKDANTMQRVAVQLKGDGTYVAKPYTDPTDFPLFCSLLTLRNWCARHSITPKF